VLFRGLITIFRFGYYLTMFEIISFLTQIPVKKAAKIEDVAAKSYLFPLAALVIGLLVSAVAFISFRFFAPIIASVLTLLTIYLITGLMHVDGLADLFDGFMASGSGKEKIRAMKDMQTGIAGTFAVVFVLLLSYAAIETVCASPFNVDLASFYHFTSVFILAEVSAKLSITTCLLLGKGFEGEAGMGALFIRHFSRSKYVVALLASVLIALLFTGSFRFLAVLTGIIVAIFISYSAKKKFGVLTGDVMGASNELARCATLVILALL
jgi:adenosylcobinamide-GDP ribazoletransferase